MNKDYYKTLNINRNASQDDIKKAFRKLSKQHHPDKGGNEEKFKEISEAYDTLSSTEKKHKYDNPNPFEDMMRGGGGGRGPNADDLFNQFFGSGRQRQRMRPKGRSLNIPLVVTLEDVYLGNTKQLIYERNVNCTSCNGYGGVAQRCTPCGGSGTIKQVVGNAFFRQVRTQPCGSCNANGFVVTEPCGSCGGIGSTKRKHTVNFTIPKDLQTGQMFNYRNMGDDIIKGEAGDLSVEVVIEKHHHFKVLGLDLLYEPRVSILDIILGKDLVIPYFNRELTTKIPENSNINSKFTLRGKGLSGGNLIVQPLIEMPKQLSQEERNNLRRLAEGNNFKIN